MHKLMCFLLSSLALEFASSAFAKAVNLLAEPTEKSAVVGSIDPAKGMVPIFNSKDHLWLKVGDPSNGNVGWIKSSELSQSDDNGSMSTGISITQKTVETSSGPKSVKIVEFGVPDKNESKKMFQEMEARQLEINSSMQRMFNDIARINASAFAADPDLRPQIPYILPVVIVPEKDIDHHKNNSKK